jgi:GNAT superfamily N-acetyltransferase
VTTDLRPARPDDATSIALWTRDTFEWGDYVAERLPSWVEDPDSMPMVTVDGEDMPIAVANVTMVSPSEAWLEGARVHPDHQRSGLGSALNRAGTSWARQRGARVARLATASDNTAAQRQVEALGYRLTCTWLHSEPDPDTGNGMEVTADLGPAWLYWSGSDLAFTGRELIAVGWRWRRARIGDLGTAVAQGQLLQCPAGWAIVEEPEPGWVRIGWLATAPEDAPSMLASLRGLAGDMGATAITLMVPATAWFRETFRRAGIETSEMMIYSLSIS